MAMSAADPGTPLGDLPGFLGEILGKVDALDGGPPSAATRDMLGSYAASVDSLAEARWQKNPLPEDVKFCLHGVGMSLHILAGEIANSRQDLEQGIQECRQGIIACRKTTARCIREIRRREAPEARTEAEDRRRPRGI
jgi:hypothetical protein